MTTDDYTPHAVEPGWISADIIRARGERHDFRLLTYADSTIRFEHVCDRGDRGVIVCAPALRTDTHEHVLTRDDRGRPSVMPSILCPDCGTHGYVTNGAWI